MDAIYKEKFQFLTESWEERDMTIEDLLQKAGKTLFYFYPKNDTPGCTIENKWFTSAKDDFKALDTNLVWVSRDSISSHIKFREKYALANDMISDPNVKLHRYFGALRDKDDPKSRVIRSSFLVSRDGQLYHKFIDIDPETHTLEVINAIKDWQSKNS